MSDFPGTPINKVAVSTAPPPHPILLPLYIHAMASTSASSPVGDFTVAEKLKGTGIMRKHTGVMIIMFYV